MANEEEDGWWGVGLQPLSVRIGLIINGDGDGDLSEQPNNIMNSSSSFINNTWLTTVTASPSSTTESTSSDLDSTQSNASSLEEKSITLGNLLGHAAAPSNQRATLSKSRSNVQASRTSGTWFNMLSSAAGRPRTSTSSSTPSLGHFLELERRTTTARNFSKRRRDTIGVVLAKFTRSSSSVFHRGDRSAGSCMKYSRDVTVTSTVVPGCARERLGRDVCRGDRSHANANGIQTLFSCVCRDTVV